MQKDLFHLGEPQPDGSVPLIKNNNHTVCVKSPLYIEENKIMGGTMTVKRMPCNNACPFFKMADLKSPDGKVTVDGVLLMCQEKPFAFELSKRQVTKSTKLQINK